MFLFTFLVTSAHFLPITAAYRSTIPTPWNTPLPRPDTSNPHNWHDGYCFSTRLKSNECNALYKCEAPQGTPITIPYCQFQIFDSGCNVIGSKEAPRVGDVITGQGIPGVVIIKDVHPSVDQRRISKGIRVAFEYFGSVYSDTSSQALVEDCRYGDPKVGWVRCVLVRVVFQCKA